MNDPSLQSGIETIPAPALLAKMKSRLDSLEQAGQSFPAVINVAAPGLDAWQWLHANKGLNRIVWSDRNSTAIAAGLGQAASVDLDCHGSVTAAIERCRGSLCGHPELQFYGGVSFNGSSVWNGFGAGKFVVPRLLLSGGLLKLAVMDADDVSQARLDLERICLQCERFETSLPRPVEKVYRPSFDGWQSRIDEALSLIRSEVLEKIVLSRQTKLKFDRTLNPIALTRRLKRTTHDCFVFCFDFGDDAAFVGASPERLFLRQKNMLQSEVVAGTRMRGRSPEEDERLAIELLTSDKDQREHDIVRKSIRQKLHKFVDHLSVDSQASILRLARKQHLRSSVKGVLKPGVEDGMLLQRLHPTPAVGGYPTDNALPEIARIERFDRGWYAAPVGCIGSESAHFAVAIRSGLVSGNQLSLYSGAGIVRGSDPDQEWQEVENKIQDFISVLG